MKRLSITLHLKFTLAFLLVAFTTAGLVGLFIHLTSADRFAQLVVSQQRSDLETILSDFYTSNGSWQGIGDYWQELISQSQHGPGPSNRTNQQPFNQRPPIFVDRLSLFALANSSGTIIVAAHPDFSLGTQLTPAQIKSGTAISVNGTRVGTIVTEKLPTPLSPEETQFLTRTNQALLLGGIGAILVALLVGVILAQQLTQPLKELTDAAGKIAQGDLEQKVEVRSRDEIGQLAHSFNQMSQEVARANLMRRQMTADIAHDLRTPMTVISGYIEAMRDQILAPTPERLTLIYNEIEQLQRLVDDLRVLSQVDAGELPLNRQWLTPEYILERAAALYQDLAKNKGITLAVQTEGQLPQLYVDESRLLQVFGNLLSNSFRYTPAGGQITLSAALKGNVVRMAVSDTGSGIDPQDLPHIFDRLYRSDTSRETNHGESGLGLAIAKAFVEAHGGKIGAELKVDQGSTVWMELPVGEQPALNGMEGEKRPHRLEVGE